MTPPTPTIVEPYCENGAIIRGSVSFPPVTGIIMPEGVNNLRLDPDVTARIDAQVQQYYNIATPLPSGWAIEDGRLVYTIVTSSVSCEEPGAG